MPDPNLERTLRGLEGPVCLGHRDAAPLGFRPDRTQQLAPALLEIVDGLALGHQQAVDPERALLEIRIALRPGAQGDFRAPALSAHP